MVYSLGVSSSLLTFPALKISLKTTLCSPHGSVFMGNVGQQIQLLLMTQSTGLQGKNPIIYPT